MDCEYENIPFSHDGSDASVPHKEVGGVQYAVVSIKTQDNLDCQQEQRPEESAHLTGNMCMSMLPNNEL